jgi:hypothetical protein
MMSYVDKSCIKIEERGCRQLAVVDRRRTRHLYFEFFFSLFLPIHKLCDFNTVFYVLIGVATVSSSSSTSSTAKTGKKVASFEKDWVFVFTQHLMMF